MVLKDKKGLAFYLILYQQTSKSVKYTLLWKYVKHSYFNSTFEYFKLMQTFIKKHTK